MIKLFEQKKGEEIIKVNYVDDNNLFAGFDMECSCCEDPQHYIEDANGNRVEVNLGYNYLEFTGELPEEDDCNMFDTCTARIPLRDRNTGETYHLVFSNCHNGWYSHEYEFGKMNIEIKKEGHI